MIVCKAAGKLAARALSVLNTQVDKIVCFNSFNSFFWLNFKEAWLMQWNRRSCARCQSDM